MIKVIFIFSLLIYSVSIYSQKVKRWIINDSTLGEIIIRKAENKIKQANSKDSIQLFFLADYFYNNIKVLIGHSVLIDTTIAKRIEPTQNDNVEKETSFFLYSKKIKVKTSSIKYIYYLVNNTQIIFPFKKGYSKIYFSIYSEVLENKNQRRIFSLEYRCDYLGRL